MSWPHARPRVLFSRCLAGDPCRYDGDRVPDTFIGRLRTHVEALNVCPEVAIGLGVPRPPIRRLAGGLLVEPSTGRDLTDAMSAFTAETLATAPTLDGAVLKSRSPSCGLGDTKLYASHEAAEPLELGYGVFAQGVQATHGGLAISDEVRLSDPSLRRAFLERLFALAWLRDTPESHRDLVPRLRHLLAQDEALHLETLEVARARTADGAVLEAISEALSRGPEPASAPTPLYPPELA